MFWKRKKEVHVELPKEVIEHRKKQSREVAAVKQASGKLNKQVKENGFALFLVNTIGGGH